MGLLVFRQSVLMNLFIALRRFLDPFISFCFYLGDFVLNRLLLFFKCLTGLFSLISGILAYRLSFILAAKGFFRFFQFINRRVELRFLFLDA